MIALVYLLGGVFIGWIANLLLVPGLMAIGLANGPAVLGGAIAWVLISIVFLGIGLWTDYR